MALTFIGETDFRQSGPPQWQQSLWDLDTLTIPYTGAEPNLTSFLFNLEKGTPSDIDQAMFLMDWRVSGSKAYPQVDLIYSGKKEGILPPHKHSSETTVASATTYTSSVIWPTIATNPASLQFYAQSNKLELINIASTTTAAPNDPDTVSTSQIITWTMGGEQPASSIPGMATWLLENAFVQAITEASDAEEIVAERYWRITKRKTRTLLPYAPAS